MKFALQAVGCGSTAKPDVLAEVARKAEELGFESLWIPEHLAVPLEMHSPYPYSPDGKFPGGAAVALHDPFIALAYVAACTQRIKLGTGVFVLPLRNAIAVAKAVASLDVLSNGRFLFGVGIGWLADEFEAVGMPFANRAARTREAIRMMKVLWSEETPSFSGRFHQFPPLGFGPKPVQQPHPPIILGGESPAALKRAAEVGEGWIGVAHTPASVGPIVATLQEHRQRAGRSAEAFEITVGPTPGLRLDRDAVDAFAAAGVHRLFTFAPGFVPRSKLSSDLFPTMER
ncbi:MAG: LLM class F420-dependent oxidoreductase, partial [bacterium]